MAKKKTAPKDKLKPAHTSTNVTRSQLYRSSETGRFVSKSYAAKNPKGVVSAKSNKNKGGGSDNTGARKANK